MLPCSPHHYLHPAPNGGRTEERAAGRLPMSLNAPSPLFRMRSLSNPELQASVWLLLLSLLSDFLGCQFDGTRIPYLLPWATAYLLNSDSRSMCSVHGLQLPSVGRMGWSILPYPELETHTVFLFFIIRICPSHCQGWKLSSIIFSSFSFIESY